MPTSRHGGIVLPARHTDTVWREQVGRARPVSAAATQWPPMQLPKWSVSWRESFKGEPAHGDSQWAGGEKRTTEQELV